ncbi:MAG: zinc-ribbon domain-containing protein [Candidatus Hodarchaeales archaeon]|jgi:ribosomal protein L40E
MVYCAKCGTKNEESAEFCVKCGAKLDVSREKNLEKRIEEGAERFGKRVKESGECFGERAEDECFGLPHGGTIAGLIFGIIIIIVGISIAAGIDLSNWWSVVIVIFGILIISGAIYNQTRKQKR